MDLHGHRRDAGLFDIERTLLDTKGTDVPLLGADRIVRPVESRFLAKRAHWHHPDRRSVPARTRCLPPSTPA